MNCRVIKRIVNVAIISLAFVAISSNAWAGLLPLGSKLPPSRANSKPTKFFQENEIPQRPALALELGDVFLGTGNLYKGFEVPILGAVWQPRLWVYSTTRTALQSFDNGIPVNGNKNRAVEWANRMDVFFNLQLTGTEKINWGVRPLDINRPGQFTGYNFREGDNREKDWFENFNSITRTFFFEGDIGSLFPFLDRGGRHKVDYGFTVGRQPLTFQEGILINDTVDAVGLVRNNIVFPGTSNLRISGMWGWGDLDRNSLNQRGNSNPNMYALFIAADTYHTTYNLDLIYTEEDEDEEIFSDAMYAGASLIRRIGHGSIALRANYSNPVRSPSPGVDEGLLLSAEFSRTVYKSNDIVYFTPYVAIDNFTQAGREPILGGPLAALGILFASPNLGNYGAEMNPLAEDVWGVAMGYQAFWDDTKRNMILEIATRQDTSGRGLTDYGIGFQMQQAVGRFIQLQLEGFYTLQGGEGLNDRSGGRAEFLLQW